MEEPKISMKRSSRRSAQRQSVQQNSIETNFEKMKMDFKMLFMQFEQSEAIRND
jgi:hypothetical protein